MGSKGKEAASVSTGDAAETKTEALSS